MGTQALPQKLGSRFRAGTNGDASTLSSHASEFSAPAGMSVRPRGPCDWDQAWMAPRQVSDLQSIRGCCRRPGATVAAAAGTAPLLDRAGPRRRAGLAGSACPVHRRGAETIAAPLIVDDDVALLDRGVVDVFHRLRPALPGRRQLQSDRVRCDSETHSHRRIGLLG